MIVVGVDGCKTGWVALVWDVDKSSIFLEVHRNFGQILDAYPKGEIEAIAIDIPIGLIKCQRACDVEARAALKCRRPSIFPAPDPRVVCIGDYHAAKQEMEGHCEKGISAQAFGIFPKVCEVNELMTPHLQNRIIEIHPEICFWAMNGFQEICPPKKSGPGYLERWSALNKSFPLPDEEWEKVKSGAKGASSDDVLDAMAAAWTARRWATDPKEVDRFPAVPEIDERGLRAEIVY